MNGTREPERFDAPEYATGYADGFAGRAYAVPFPTTTRGGSDYGNGYDDGRDARATVGDDDGTPSRSRPGDARITADDDARRYAVAYVRGSDRFRVPAFDARSARDGNG